MPVHLPSPEKYAEIEAVLAEHHTVGPPEVVNAAAVLDLGADREIEYRGRRYLARPISYREGIRLQAVLSRLGDLQKMDSAGEVRVELLAFYRDAIDLCGRLMRPAGWRGVLWRIGLRGRNPFADAGEADLAVLLASFWIARTKPSVRSSAGRSIQAGRSSTT